MEFGQIAGIDKKVSRLVQGTIMLKKKNAEAGCELLDAVFAAGINAFDTAALYGGGDCERVFGQWLESRGHRDQIFIIGKAAHYSEDRNRVTPFDITADLHDSLARQHTDHIDLFFLHRDDLDVGVGPIVDVLNEHKDAGRIGAFGGSNWSVQRIQEANEYADKHGLAPFTATSPHFSLAVQQEPPWPGCVSLTGDDRAADRQWYTANDMPVFAWASLSTGFLTGRLTRQNAEDMRAEIGPDMARSYYHELNFERLDRVHELAQEKGVSVPQLALAWVIQHSPLDVYPLVGNANAGECSANVKALSIELSEAERDWLNLDSDRR